ncbi:MAG: hypothetical protein ACLFTR_04775 [Candidatus Woesearchaeota archaeon]
MLEFLSFVAMVLVVFSGLIFGRVFLFIAPEENKAGKIWFRVLSSVFLAAVMLSATKNVMLGVMLASAAFLVMIMAKDNLLKDRMMRGFLSGILGIVLGVLLFTSPSRPVTASFMFMFLMAYSSLTFFPSPKDVNLRRYHVKNKLMYLKEISVPFFTVFISVLLAFLGF